MSDFVHGDFVQRTAGGRLYAFVVEPGRVSFSNQETLMVYRIGDPPSVGLGCWLVENTRHSPDRPTEAEVAEFVAYMLAQGAPDGTP